MGKFLVILFIIGGIFFLIMRAFGKFIANMRGDTRTNSSYQQQRRQQNPPQKTETQEDRIIDYQKKSFEATKVEDVEFEEVK